MFAIEVELLTGRYVATAHDDRRRAEWPPHPARFFSALVAAHYEGTASGEEREALLWLERQPAPSLELSAAFRRDVHDVFVPVNDVTPIGDLERPLRDRVAARDALRRASAEPAELRRAEKAIQKAQVDLRASLAELDTADERPTQKALDAAGALLPESRTRQVRTFPVVIPENPVFVFAWPTPPPPAVHSALERLSARVTRLGHSSSLVWCRVATRTVNPTLVPRDDGRLVLRTVGSGQLERLDRAWAQHQGVHPRVLSALPQRYGPVLVERALPPMGAFSSEGWLLFERVGGARPMASGGVSLTQGLRAALLEQHGEAGLAPALSGHDPGGGRTTVPHLAYVALPWVGDSRADGSIKGFAIIPPRELAPEHREQLLRLVARWEATRAANGRLSLAGSNARPVQLERVQLPTMKSTTPSVWTRESTRFVTATPIALDRNPGNLRSNLERTAHKAAREAEETIATACANVGLPRPRGVRVALEPLLQGVQPAQAFRPLPSKPGRPPRVRVHAMIEFETPIRGPLLLGAGRHFGLGLCLPVEGGRS